MTSFGKQFHITDDRTVLFGSVVSFADFIDSESFVAQIVRLPDTEQFRNAGTTYYLGKLVRMNFSSCSEIGITP